MGKMSKKLYFDNKSVHIWFFFYKFDREYIKLLKTNKKKENTFLKVLTKIIKKNLLKHDLL